MTSPAMSANSSHRSDIALRWIGDLDHTFYDDERNRYVWYEAQAIGFQFMALASYAVAAIALLVAGSSALPYALAMVAPVAVAAIVLKGYVARRGADYWPQSMDFRRSRGLAALAVMGLLFVGFVRAYLGTDGGSGAIAGLFVGGAAAGIAVAVASQRHKNSQADLGDED